MGGNIMPSWASVIGIEYHRSPGRSLQGAVRDALRMCQWLTEGSSPRVDARSCAAAVESEPSWRPTSSGSPLQATSQQSRYRGDLERLEFQGSGILRSILPLLLWTRIDDPGTTGWGCLTLIRFYQDALRDSFTPQHLSEFFKSNQFNQKIIPSP